MNRVYRIIWNVTVGAWQVASELATARRKAGRARSRLVAAGAVLFASGLAAAQTPALPAGGTIVGGAGEIERQGETLTVTQATSRLAADWQSFSVGAGHRVEFVQPSASAVALNRVLGPDASVIQGALNANGQVFLVNPNGVLFSPGAEVNVGGLVASTLDIGTGDFMAGDYTFEGGSSGAIVNQGNIRTTAGGTVALIAARIVNEGVIEAPAGTVLMGAGSRVALDLGGPVRLEVEAAALDALVEQGGAVRASGGRVYLTAKAAGDLAATVINHTGVTEARGLATNAAGEIALVGDGAVRVAGTLDASAPASGSGGRVVTTGEHVTVAAGARLNASGAGGGGEVLVGGSWQNEDAGVPQARTTEIHAGAVLDASATVAGDGGTVVAWSDLGAADGMTRVRGTLAAQAGAAGGDGGRVETSGHRLEVEGARVSTRAAEGATGLWLLDPYDITIASAPSANVSSSGSTTFESHGNDAVISIATIDAALDDTNVTIQTGAAGAEAGDIRWEPDYTYTGGAARTLTLNAHRDIFLDGFIKSSGGALATTFTADSDANGSGGVVIAKDIETAGGAFTVNGLGAIFSGETAQTVATAGGDVAINGDVIVANVDGLTVSTAGGDVAVAGVVNSGNDFGFDPTARTFATALSAYGSTSASAGATYLATLTSALENTAAGAASGGEAGWLGGSDALQEGVWRWTTGPEGAGDGGDGQIFWTVADNATGSTGYSGYEGSYVNWNAGEPNDSGNEDALQFGFSAANLWNDLPTGSNLLGSILETNLAASPLSIDAGAGTVTFGDKVGNTKALASLDVTAASIAINGESVRTEGVQTYAGDVTFGGLAQFVNPSFEEGTTGWSITNSQVYLNGVSTIAGFPTPADTSYPATVVSGCDTGTGAGCDTTSFSGSFSTQLSSDVAAGAGSQSLVMNSSGTCSSGFCITRGPYVVSDSTVTLPTGGTVAFKWQAKGGSDAYDVFGYLLDTANGGVQPILNGTGSSASATQLWTSASVSVDQPGTYKFVFVSGSWDASGGRALGAQLFIDDIQASGGAKLIEASQAQFLGSVEAADNRLTLRADEIDFHGAVGGTNEITLEQRATGTPVVLGDAAAAGAGVLDLTGAELSRLQDGFAGITVGAAGGTAGVTIAGPAQFLDPVTVRGGAGGITLADTLSTGGADAITLDSAGTVSQAAGAAISAGGGLALLGAGGQHELDAAANTVGTLAAATGSLNFSHAGELDIGSVGDTEGVAATGPVAIATAAGDLDVAADVATSDASADAIVLNAGRDAAAGDVTGGDVRLTGSPAISTGAGGRALLYSGSIAGSSGVEAAVGSGSGRFRYASDETETGFTAPLGTGLHAVYREQPAPVTVTANDGSKVYDGQAYDGAAGVSVTGLFNGDELAGTATYSAGVDAGTHALTPGGLSSALGYSVVFADGTLTVTPRPVAVAAEATAKTYGDADPALGFQVESANGARGLLGQDTLSGALTRAAGETVGRYAIGQGTLANGNYAIAFTGADLSIDPRPVTLVADAASKVYGESDPALGVSLGGGTTLGSATVADTLAEVTGTLTRAAGEDAGSYDVLLGSGARAGNYTITYAADNDAFAITPRPVTVAAEDQQKLFGEPDPALTYVAAPQAPGRGLLARDMLQGTLVREQGEGLGLYAIEQGTLDHPSYRITFERAELEIVEPALPAPAAGAVAEAQAAGNGAAGDGAGGAAGSRGARAADADAGAGAGGAGVGASSQGLRFVAVDEEPGAASAPGASGGGARAAVARDALGPLEVLVVRGGINVPATTELDGGERFSSTLPPR